MADLVDEDSTVRELTRPRCWQDPNTKNQTNKWSKRKPRQCRPEMFILYLSLSEGVLMQPSQLLHGSWLSVEQAELQKEWGGKEMSYIPRLYADI